MLYLRLFAALLLLGVCIYPCSAEDWIKVESKEMGFSVLMPGAPVPDSLFENGDGFYTYKYLTNDQEPNKSYIVQFLSLEKAFDPKLIEGAVSQTILGIENEIAEDSLNKSFVKKDITSKEGFRGVELSYINTKDKDYYIIKSFIVGGNLVLATVVTKPDYRNNGNITKFFNSLELNKVQPIVFQENAHEDKWKRIESEYGGFSSLYPGEPTASEAGDSAASTNEFVYEQTEEDDPNYNYSTIFLENGLTRKEYNDRDSINNVLKSIKDTYVKSAQFTVVKEEPVMNGGYVGREFTLQTKDKSSLLKARFFVVRNKVIGSRVYTKPENDNNKNMRKFLNSLVIFNRDSLNEILRNKIVWKKYRSDDGLFTVNMPGEPKLSVDTIGTNGVPLYYHYQNYISDKELDTVYVYEGYYVEIPKTLFDMTRKDVRNQILHSSSTGFIKGSGGTLFYERPVEYENYPGVEVAGTILDGAHYVKARFFAVEDHVIAVYGITDSDLSDKADFNKYFNTLHISKVAPKRTREAPAWKNIILEAPACEAQFPGSPKALNNEADGIQFKGFSLSTDDSDDPNTDYIVQYSLNNIDSKKLEPLDSAKHYLHAEVESFYQKLNGNLIKEEFFELGGYRGVAATMTDASGSILISARFFS